MALITWNVVSPDMLQVQNVYQILNIFYETMYINNFYIVYMLKWYLDIFIEFKYVTRINFTYFFLKI